MKWLGLAFLFASIAIGLMLTANSTSVYAAPKSGGGIVTVNTSNDSDVRGDSEVSLREAISITNGTLLGPFSLAERGQMSGCAFDSFGNISNSCGGSNNVIQFTPTLTQVVLSNRPGYMTSPGTTLNGQVNSGYLIINGAGGADNGPIIQADSVTITHTAIINIPGPAAYIQTYVSGAFKGIRIANNYLGVLPDTTSCSDPRLTAKANFPIIIWVGGGTAGAGDGSAYIYGNVIGCSPFDGIEVSAPYVYIGQDPSGAPSRNWIGVMPTGFAVPMLGSGISLFSSGALGAVIISNTIAYNSGDGINSQSTPNITIAGNIVHHNIGNGIQMLASPNITITGNSVYNNTVAGIKVVSSTLNSLTNNIAHDNQSSGIWLSGGNSTLDSITGGAYYNNGAAGITEGEGAGNNTWRSISTYNNFGLGIDKNDNGVPDLPPLTIDSVVQATTGVTVTGQYNDTLFLLNIYYIDLYRIARDPTGYGEGRTYVGSASLEWGFPLVTTWQINDPAGAGCYTAVVTVIDGLGGTTSHSSSEFSRNLECKLFLPLVVK